jgi:site-specific DNA-methyltransferase (adenine-specific)
MTCLLPAFVGAPAVNTVYHVDALTLLRAMPAGSVDCVVTSPPYNIERTGSASGVFANYYTRFLIDSAYKTYDDNMPELEYQEWLRNIVAECLRVSKGLVWINHKMRFRDGAGIHPLRFLPFPVWSEVIWNRRSSMALNARKYAPSHEYVFGFGKPHYWNNEHNTLMTVWNITRGQNDHDDEHPCPYPPALIRPLIESSCPVGGVVLDPFMGSGTTGQVSRATGRDYIGCDISPEYVEVARKRLAQPWTPQMFLDHAEVFVS